MKKLFAFFLLFVFCIPSYSQMLSGILRDSITNKPLDLASITFSDTNFTVFTDAEGTFKAKIPNNSNQIEISYIGYESRKLKLNSFSEDKNYNVVLSLMPKAELLEEIVVSKAKVNYSATKSLKFTRENTSFFAFQFGTENCSFIANPYHKRGKLKEISLNLKKVYNHAKECRKCEVDYITTYNIKCYSYDSISNKPGVEIYNRNIIVEPLNKTYKLSINLDSLSIPFPENGICIGVETVNTKYTNPKKAGAYTGPAIAFSNNKSVPVNAWVRYRQEGWVFKPAATFPNRSGNTYNAMIIDVAASIEKQ